jgi:hypothetical protein
MKEILSWIANAKHYVSIGSNAMAALRHCGALPKRGAAPVAKRSQTEGRASMISAAEAVPEAMTRFDVKRVLEFLEHARFCGNCCLCAFVTLVLRDEKVVLSYLHESGRTTTLVFGARDANGKRGFSYTTDFGKQTKGFYE